MKDCLLLGTDRREFKKFVPLAYGGHCYYVRKCKRYDTDEHGHPIVKGVYLPDYHNEWTSQVEVLAIGPAIGKLRDKKHREKYGGPAYVASDVKVGDILMCPNEHAGIKASPLGNEEYFIEEFTPYYRFR